MAFSNSYEEISKKETQEYIESRPVWRYGSGRIPALDDYLKISCDSEDEAMKLAKYGAILTEKIAPGTKLFFTQALLVGAISHNADKYRSIMMICPSRYGKMLYNDCPVPTPQGWVKHGSLKVGDYVFSPNGVPVKVKAVSGEQLCDMAVTMNTGEIFYTHSNHEWVLTKIGNKRQKIYETKSLYEMLKNGDDMLSRLVMPKPSPLVMSKKSLTQNKAYYVGSELANGSLIADWLLCSSIDTRLWILAGVFDSYKTKFYRNGCICINPVSQEQSEQIKNILSSLSQPHYSIDGIGNSLSPIIVTPTIEVPTVRKMRIRPNKKLVFGCKITNIEKLSPKDLIFGKCIEVESPDGQYLIGNFPTVTHNSMLTGISGIIQAALIGAEIRIGGATRDKADLVMEKIVQILPRTSKEVQDGMIITDEEKDVNKKIARLSTQTSREALAWKGGGSIKLFTLNETSKNTEIAAQGAIGIGGDVMILDECVDGDTEILTENGFVKFKDLKDGVKVAQFNMDGTLQFVLPTKVTRLPKAKREAYAVYYDYRREPIIMTKHHRQPLLYNGKEVPTIDEISDIVFDKSKYIITGAKNCWDEFAFTNGRRNTFLRAIQKNYKLSDFFPYRMNYETCREIIQELLQLGAYINSDGVLVYRTGDIDNANFISAISVQAGYGSKMIDLENGLYRVEISPNNLVVSTTFCKKNNITYKDAVYCVSVPSTMFIARKGGFTFVTGNTQLISNKNYYTARRFFAQSSHTKLVELGNPMKLGHFKDIYDDESTFVIHMNDVTSIIEGRMTRKDFELARIPKHTLEYRAFVQCLFPQRESSNGFFPTLPKPLSELTEKNVVTRISFLGVDSAYKGADGLVVSVISLCRSDTKAWVELVYQEDIKRKYPTWQSDTTVNIALDILKIREKFNCVAGAIDIAFGIHIYEMLYGLADDFPMDPVNFGNKPTESRKNIHYSSTWAYNLRAEMHLDLRELCEGELMYINDEFYDEIVNQMVEVKAENELGKIKVENKSKIKQRLGRSPDNLDSLCLAVRAMVMSGFMGGAIDSGEEIAYIG